MFSDLSRLYDTVRTALTYKEQLTKFAVARRLATSVNAPVLAGWAGGAGRVCVGKGRDREGKCFLFVCARVQCDIPPLIGAT